MKSPIFALLSVALFSTSAQAREIYYNIFPCTFTSSNGGQTRTITLYDPKTRNPSRSVVCSKAGPGENNEGTYMSFRCDLSPLDRNAVFHEHVNSKNEIENGFLYLVGRNTCKLK